MARVKLLLDTNVVLDYAARREPFYEKARLLMIAGRVGEFDLWITATQATDLVYVLSNGGRKSEIGGVLEQLRAMRQFVSVCPVMAPSVDAMLASSWDDPEDALLVDAALRIRADAIVTRDSGFLQAGDTIKVVDIEGLFDWLNSEFGLSYAEVAVPGPDAG